MVTGEKICFVICPIGEPDSDERRLSDKVLKHIVKPAAAACGYRAMRADEIDRPGNITSQVLGHVMEAPMVVADLTGRNPNVFYELALRHALQKPLVQIIYAAQAIPFDVRTERTVKYDLQDPDSVEAAKEEIGKQIRAVEKDAKQVDNPISVAINLDLLKQSGNPLHEQLAAVLIALAELRRDVQNLAPFVPGPIEAGYRAMEAKRGDIAPPAQPPPRRIVPFKPVLPPLPNSPSEREESEDK